MSVVIIFLTLLYIGLIGSFIIGFDRVKEFELSDLKPHTRFSIIIPFRNEETDLPFLLKSIEQLSYPKDYYEIIFVNDASNDHSVEIIESFIGSLGITPVEITVINNIRLTNSPKKDAITLAISQAKYDWIVTTDADCILPRYWLDCFDEHIQKHHSNVIAAPVTYIQTTGFLQHFQLLEILSLQGATIGGFGLKNPFLCNGANLAYKKKLFKTVQGFEGNNTIASGDDIFLLEKAVRLNHKKVHYLKSQKAVVLTSAQTSLNDLIAQRIRWAAKTRAYNRLFGKVAGAIILFQNTIVVCSYVFTIAGWMSVMELLSILILKMGIDVILIYKTADFFQQKGCLRHYLFSALYYPLFTIYIAFSSLFTGYKWKGRTYVK